MTITSKLIKSAGKTAANGAGSEGEQVGEDGQGQSVTDASKSLSPQISDVANTNKHLSTKKK